MTKVVITAGGGVTTHDILSVYLCGDGYMLANGETKDIIWAWKAKAISKSLVNMVEYKQVKHRQGSVRGNDNLFFEGELLPFFWIKDSPLG
jgi:hypothetical protein